MSKLEPQALARAALGLAALAYATSWADTPKSDAAKPGVAAIVSGEEITTAELDAKVLKTNMKLAQSLYDGRKAALDTVIVDKLLAKEAKEKGVSTDQVLKDRISERVKPVTDADVQAYFNANSARMGGRTLEQVSGQIKNMLTGQQEQSARDAVIKELKEKAGVRVLLEVPRVEIAVAANDPVKGPKDAKVTIIEFSEFQ